MPSHAPLAVLFAVLLGATIAFVPSSPRRTAPERSEPERIETHDNLRPAGRLQDGVLTLRLEARTGTWFPHGPRGASAEVPALGEARRRLQIPSPMIRVPAGTEVHLTVTNQLADVLTMHGLVSRPVPAGATDSVSIAPGITHELRFRLDEPGTYFYWGTTMGRAFIARTKEDAQLNGAIIVDEPGAALPRERDRVLIMSQWADTTPSARNPDTGMRQLLLVVNGRSWPHTERLSYTAGDSVRWRVINASANVHPMHLHGFYFRVDARGDGLRDTVYAASGRDMAVTERMDGSSTMTMTWVPERPGNWLFHCHFTSHFSPRGPLGIRLDESTATVHANASTNHAREAMAGLVVGVTVKPRRTGTRTHIETTPRRRVRMLVRASERGATHVPIYDVALHEGGTEPPPADRVRAGPPLVLERGVPAAITVVNRTSSPTAIHWHGMELESYFDGVAGFSGDGRRTSPLIAPGDSFEVHMTPPRAGTFIYHTHVDELRQQPGGLSGALIVVEPGARWDPVTDIPVLIASPGDPEEERRAVLVNGSATPAPLTVRIGVPHRLRIINITTARPNMLAELRRGGDIIAWRALAKDGADLPADRRHGMPARQTVSIGETFDFEFTPREAGEYRLEMRTAVGELLATLPLVAVAAEELERDADALDGARRRR